MSHRCSPEELELTRGFSASQTNAFCTGVAFCYFPGCGMWSKIEGRSLGLTMTESMGDCAGSFTSCSWSPSSSLSEAGTILASHPGQSCSVRGWWRTLLGSWHLSCILSAPIWQRHCLSSFCHSIPRPPCTWRTVPFKISSRREQHNHLIRLLAFRMSSLPRCEDGVDGGQLDSVSVHVMRVLNMQKMVYLSMSPFPLVLTT